MLTVLNGGGASTCTVTGLMKYQSYEFFIVPFYKTVEGKPSNSRVARTLEDGKFASSILKKYFFFVGSPKTRNDIANVQKHDDIGIEFCFLEML